MDKVIHPQIYYNFFKYNYYYWFISFSGDVSSLTVQEHIPNSISSEVLPVDPSQTNINISTFGAQTHLSDVRSN